MPVYEEEMGGQIMCAIRTYSGAKTAAALLLEMDPGLIPRAKRRAAAILRKKAWHMGETTYGTGRVDVVLGAPHCQWFNINVDQFVL